MLSPCPAKRAEGWAWGIGCPASSAPITDQPVLPARRPAGTRHGTAGLPRGHHGTAARARWSGSAACRRWWTIWPTTMCSGRLVQELGLEVRAGRYRAGHDGAGDDLRALWRHELRWARTIRTLVPVQFAASVAAVSVGLGGARRSPRPGARPGRWPGSPPPGRSVRSLAARGGRTRALGASAAFRSPLWLLPLRELMSVAVMAASYAGRQVDWRGHTTAGGEDSNPR